MHVSAATGTLMIRYELKGGVTLSHIVWIAFVIAVRVVATVPSRRLKLTSAAVSVMSSRAASELICGPWAAAHVHACRHEFS